MAAKVDVAKLSDVELAELSEGVMAEQARRKNEALKEALAKVKEIAAGIGMTVEELLESEGKKKKAPQKGIAKYRNPENPEQTWTGKGQRPRWFLAALESGVTPEDMLI